MWWADPCLCQQQGFSNTTIVSFLAKWYNIYFLSKLIKFTGIQILTFSNNSLWLFNIHLNVGTNRVKIHCNGPKEKKYLAKKNYCLPPSATPFSYFFLHYHVKKATLYIIWNNYPLTALECKTTVTCVARASMLFSACIKISLFEKKMWPTQRPRVWIALKTRKSFFRA